MSPAVGQRLPAPARECVICGAMFERRSGERRWLFVKRKTCGEDCRRELLSRVVPRVPDPVFNPETGCLEWQGSLDSYGYGHRGVNGHLELVHRTAYREAYGDIPEGHDVHHRCENRRCVNPEHLQALDHGEHSRLHHGSVAA